MKNSSDTIYHQVRAMAANFEFKPGERLNESKLSKELGTSRTPLREALNRLVAEGLLTLTSGQGFFCRSLDPEQVVNLYQLREAIEAEAIMRAVERASDEEIAELQGFLRSTANSYHKEATAKTLVALDEEFHLRLVKLAKNPELVHTLEIINERIRYVRWIVMRKKIEVTHAGHQDIIDVLVNRNTKKAVSTIRKHIEIHNELATEIVRTAFSQMYVPSA